MIGDELKLNSGDSFFNEDHILFLIDKYRALLLKQRYTDIRKEVPYADMQSLCIDLEEIDPDTPCTPSYLRSVSKIPDIIGSMENFTTINPIEGYSKHLAFVSSFRFPYVNSSKWLKNIIYVTIDTDHYLKVTSQDSQFLHLNKLKVTSVFTHPEEASKLSCDSTTTDCNYLDTEYPLESALIPYLIQSIVKELMGSKYQPEDEKNDSRDGDNDVKVS